MRAFLIGLLLYGVFFIFGRWYFVCETLGKCDTIEEPTLLPERAKTLYLYDGDTLIAGPFNQFYFEENSVAPILDESNEAFLGELESWLQQNPERRIMLTGKNTPREKLNWQSKIYEFPGIARAAWLESFLEEKGIDQKRIETDYFVTKNDSLFEPILFEVLPLEQSGYDIPQYRFEDNTFSDANFEFNSAVFKPGVQLAEYADSVKTFLGINPDYILTIIGHTDSIGTEAYNMQLGLERAQSAKEYFEELGITTPINTVSMGKTQYAAPNSNPDGTDNEEGRQKNRRVNFKLNTEEQ